MPKVPLIFLIAGEASGDQLGADLMIALKEIQEVRFAGIGGEAMKAEGLESFFPMEELSLIGVVSILRNLPQLLGRLTSTVKTIQALKPDAVITIDAPEFSLRVLKKLHKLPNKPRLVHYVAPTVWAWRPGMAKKVSVFLDRLLCLYSFEPPYFEKYGLKTNFVGHPVAREKTFTFKRNENLLCVLPGSRRSEIQTLLPIFKETVLLLQKDIPDLKIVLPTIPAVESLVREGVKDWHMDVQIVLGDEERKKAFGKSSAALAASGTVALQLAAANLPFVIAYKMGTLNAWIARRLIKTPWACMVNILLAFNKFGATFVLNQKAKELVPELWIPEFIQEECRAGKIAPALLKLLKDKEAQESQNKAMKETILLLKAPYDAVASAVIEEISWFSSH